MYSRNMNGISRRVTFERTLFSETIWMTNCTPICMTKQPETVVITGASAGVGRATAHEFARRGAHIALLARGNEGLEGAAAEVHELGGRAWIMPVDVANHDDVEAVAEEVERRIGPIEIWINNAM